jgi:hypothetical protein
MQAHLLPNYDEYFIAYRDRSAVADPELFKDEADVIRFLYGYIATMNGRVVGGWKRRIEKDRLVVEIRLPISLDKDGRDALKTAAEQYSVFVGKPMELRVS